MTARIMGWKVSDHGDRHLCFECYGACFRCKGWVIESRQWEVHGEIHENLALTPVISKVSKSIFTGLEAWDYGKMVRSATACHSRA